MSDPTTQNVQRGKQASHAQGLRYSLKEMLEEVSAERKNFWIPLKLAKCLQINATVRERKNEYDDSRRVRGQPHSDCE